MRTTLNIDDEALAGAMKVAGGQTKTDVINQALREYARRRRVRGLLKFRGKVRWEGDLDELRQRRPRPRVRVLVDTSVWADFLNGYPSPQAAALGELLGSDDELCTCGPPSTASSP